MLLSPSFEKSFQVKSTQHMFQEISRKHQETPGNTKLLAQNKPAKMGLEPPPCVVFVLFCLLVPVFMAYNGGATAATVDTIQHEEKWSPAGIGLLGALSCLILLYDL